MFGGDYRYPALGLDTGIHLAGCGLFFGCQGVLGSLNPKPLPPIKLMEFLGEDPGVARGLA